MAQMIVAGLRIILQFNMSIYLPRWRILTTNKATISATGSTGFGWRSGVAVSDESHESVER